MRVPIEAHGSAYVIEVDPEGLIGGRIVASNAPYEAPLLEHIYERGFTGTALDVGAHVGNHTLWLAVVCGLSVFAFEPLEHEALRHNVALNGLENRVTVRAVALGEESGTARVVGKGKLEVGEGEIQVVALDDWALEGVSVVKIDVEDMEPQVLRGARDTIARCRPSIYAEARDEQCHALIAAELEPHGYRLVERFGVRQTPVERWEP